MTRLERMLEDQGHSATVMAATREKDANYSRIFTLALFALFIVMLMIALLACVNVYKSLDGLGSQSDSERLSHALVANVVRANDSADAISIESGPEGDALVLTERLPSGNYENRIYLSDGSIMQEYAVAGTAYSPEKATSVAPSGVFDVSIDGPLVTIVTDDGLMQVATRCGGSEK